MLFIFSKISLRDNDLLELPMDIGNLKNLKELHIQSNRLQLFPQSTGKVKKLKSKAVLKTMKY